MYSTFGCPELMANSTSSPLPPIQKANKGPLLITVINSKMCDYSNGTAILMVRFVLHNAMCSSAYVTLAGA
ncbi:unnamed protein product [Cylicocyclus nassatus]|uniref:Uncharacterized protein n=1 Tax=Cylicocyclus nassatus TaxID=53992 RepID=A0AA36H462_CYLNA|nr:unnamed protein product [Cylicocyclus nassatus]